MSFVTIAHMTCCQSWCNVYKYSILKKVTCDNCDWDVRGVGGEDYQWIREKTFVRQSLPALYLFMKTANIIHHNYMGK